MAEETVSDELVNGILQELLKTAAVFVKSCKSDDSVSDGDAISAVLNGETDPSVELRTVRKWATYLPDMAKRDSSLSEGLHHLVVKAINYLSQFLDSLLLFCYRKHELSLNWHSLTEDTHTKLLLALTITLQTLTNLLSANRLLKQTAPLRSIWSVLHVLLSSGRAKFLLTRSRYHPFASTYRLEHYRLTSYTSLLLDYLLTEFQRSAVNLQFGFSVDLIYKEIFYNLPVFQSVVYYANKSIRREPDDANFRLLNERTLHYQLLLTHMANYLDDHLSDHDPSDGPELCISLDVPEFFVTVMTATGLVLLLQHDAYQDDDHGPGMRCLPTTLRPCLGLWRQANDGYVEDHSYLAELLVINVFDETEAWRRKLVRYAAEVTDKTDLDKPPTPQDVSIFPYAYLRGLVHIASELVFVGRMENLKILAPDHSAREDRPGSPYHPPLLTSWISSPEHTKTEQLLNWFAEDHLDRLWDAVSDLLVLIVACSKYLESTAPTVAGTDKLVDPLTARMSGDSAYPVYPSRMSKLVPRVPFTSPMSVCQLTGMKHDCIRCMVGLMSQAPRLVCRLAEHTLRVPFCSPVEVEASQQLAKSSAFDALLEATNRDPSSPLAAEWAILVLRLALRPDPASIQADDDNARITASIGQLSARMNNLKLLQ